MIIDFKKKIKRETFIKKCAAIGITVAASPFILDLYDHLMLYASGSVKEASFYKSLNGGMVKCLRCPVFCVIGPDKVGICKTRLNVRGVLSEEAYGKPCVINVDNIEKGPLYHVLPGIKGLAFGTAGCNLKCFYCQNWNISQEEPRKTKNIPTLPSEMSQKALTNKLEAIIFTYTEPMVFTDYMEDVAKMAKFRKLLTHCCTSAFINKEPLQRLFNVIDVFTVTLKGFNNDYYEKVCGQPLQPVMDSLIQIKKENKWVEIVNLIVPTLNDGKSAP